jgi:hypothetical protein
MQVLRNKALSLAALGLFTGLSATALTGCPEGGLCGPCGGIATGQLSVSGDARLDGFLKAVADLDGAIGTVSADFDANITALAEVWGFVEAGAEVEVNGQFVTDLVAHIRGELSANIQGGIRIEYQPPACSASLNVAVEAQASCEANAGCECEVEVDPGEVSVECEGKCEGSCSAGCEGEIVCETGSAGVACEGTCEGSCEIEAGASCEGTCRGDCDGECSLVNTMGGCEGQCNGMCSGTCEMSAGATCEGTCHGSCKAEVEPPGCMGEITCSGSCMGECGGSCEGSFEPPSASADCECEASADCNAQASAQAEANVSCTPPSLAFAFELSGEAAGSASAEAAFRAKIDALRVRGIAILQGAAKMQALVTGKAGFSADAEVIFDPSPVANLTGEIEAVVSAGLSGEFDIPPGRIECVIPALREAVEIMGGIATEAGASVSAQVEFSAFLLNPTG